MGFRRVPASRPGHRHGRTTDAASRRALQVRRVQHTRPSGRRPFFRLQRARRVKRSGSTMASELSPPTPTTGAHTACRGSPGAAKWCTHRFQSRGFRRSRPRIRPGEHAHHALEWAEATLSHLHWRLRHLSQGLHGTGNQLRALPEHRRHLVGGPSRRRSSTRGAVRLRWSMPGRHPGPGAPDPSRRRGGGRTQARPRHVTGDGRRRNSSRSRDRAQGGRIQQTDAGILRPVIAEILNVLGGNAGEVSARTSWWRTRYPTDPDSPGTPPME